MLPCISVAFTIRRPCLIKSSASALFLKPESAQNDKLENHFFSSTGRVASADVQDRCGDVGSLSARGEKKTGAHDHSTSCRQCYELSCFTPAHFLRSPYPSITAPTSTFGCASFIITVNTCCFSVGRPEVGDYRRLCCRAPQGGVVACAGNFDDVAARHPAAEAVFVVGAFSKPSTESVKTMPPIVVTPWLEVASSVLGSTTAEVTILRWCPRSARCADPCRAGRRRTGPGASRMSGSTARALLRMPPHSVRATTRISRDRAHSRVTTSAAGPSPFGKNPPREDGRHAC